MTAWAQETASKATIRNERMASTPLRHSECSVPLYQFPDTPSLLVTFFLLSLHGALLPLNVADLFELEIRRVDLI
jgi:hypothetical protein